MYLMFIAEFFASNKLIS